MRIGTLHRLSMTGAASAPVLGVMSGSGLLLGAGLTLVLVFVATSGRLHAERAPGARLVVHGLTVLGLVFALAVFSRARFDSILLVVMLGMFNRFVLRAGPRDDMIVLGASAVLMAATTVVTPSLAFLFAFIAFVILALWALLASQLAAAARSDPSILERTAPKARGFLAVTGLSFMVVGYGLFSLFPRYNFARFLGAGAFLAFSGAGDSMELERGGSRGQGRGRVVMRVEPEDGSRATLEGLYARLYALDRFDGARFSRSRRGPDLPLYRRWQAGLPTPGAVRAHVWLLRTETRSNVHPIAALGRSAPAKVELPRAHTRVDGTWLSGFRNNAMSLEYTVSLSERAPPRPLPGAFHDRALERAKRLPEEVDDRIRGLAARLTAGLTDDDAKIRAVVSHFSRGYRYSLDPPAGSAPDPLVRFIFEAKAGHCELYAAAVAVLLRSVDLPARVATGYYGGYWNSAGGYLELSDEDAHAWVEVFDRKTGWRWVDATPESERSGARREKTLAFVRDLYDRLEALWYAHVIDFDEQQRQRMVRGVTARWTETDLGGLWDGLSSSRAPPRDRVSGLALGTVLLVIASAGWFVFRRSRRSVHAVGAELYRVLGGSDARTLTFGALLGRVPAPLREAAGPVVAEYEAFRFGSGVGEERTVVPRDLVRRIRRLASVARAAKRDKVNV